MSLVLTVHTVLEAFQSLYHCFVLFAVLSQGQISFQEGYFDDAELRYALTNFKLLLIRK